jgi:hypothetical protein
MFNWLKKLFRKPNNVLFFDDLIKDVTQISIDANGQCIISWKNKNVVLVGFYEFNNIEKAEFFVPKKYTVIDILYHKLLTNPKTK